MKLLTFFRVLYCRGEGSCGGGPFPPLGVLQVSEGLFGQWEVQAPSEVSERALIVVTLLAPSEVRGKSIMELVG